MASEATASDEDVALTLQVGEALSKDVGRGCARLDPGDLARLGAKVGDILALVGKRTTAVKALPAYAEHRGQGLVQIDGLTRRNAGVTTGQAVRICPAHVVPARELVLRPAGGKGSARSADSRYVGRLLEGLPVTAGDQVRATLFGSRTQDFEVVRTKPRGDHLVITAQTRLEIEGRADKERGKVSGIAYEDIGGLRKEIHRVREMVELPLRHPQLFERLGIDAPKGVLLHGPPGTGKTLLARAVAHETDSGFITVSGPEVIHKFYGESEAKLREIFEQARKKAPCIIFLDEIDALAPRREDVQGEVEKRVVAQLLALMDGLEARGQIIVIGATNLPNRIDPALRRPGRFDREVEIGIPDASARQEILEIHTRGMPLADDVDVARIASITHGYVGADLEALAREAAMTTLRKVIPELDLASRELPYELLMSLEVDMDDFESAFAEIEPSAIREVFVEVPDVSWDDVGGLQDVKRQLREAVEWPLVHRDLLRHAGVRTVRGILLHGPPGTGKTLLAKAIASQSGVNFISVKGPSLLSKYVGESERGIREVFKKARQAAPCIVFFDELDALAPTRRAGDADQGVGTRVMSQLLTELDGVEELKGVLVMGATNRLDMLDDALIRPGRFDLLIEVGLPDEDSRARIFEVHLAGKPIEAAVEPGELARRAEGMTGAEIESVCQRATLAALRRHLDAFPDGGQRQALRVTRDDLDDALRQLGGLGASSPE